MRPGKPEWVEDDYRYWGKCVRILRENSANFHSDSLEFWSLHYRTAFISTSGRQTLKLFTLFSAHSRKAFQGHYLKHKKKPVTILSICGITNQYKPSSKMD